MNFSEEQKKILLKYMREHADFGRGRLCYAGENKRIMVRKIVCHNKFLLCWNYML